jgi:hypothetical protein
MVAAAMPIAGLRIKRLAEKAGEWSHPLRTNLLRRSRRLLYFSPHGTHRNLQICPEFLGEITADTRVDGTLLAGEGRFAVVEFSDLDLISPP